MKHKYNIFATLLLIISLSIIVACSNNHRQQRTIAVSIQPQKYLLEKIVGEKFNVICLLSQGSNPEAYEPNMAHLMNLEKSEAFFKIGNIGFELAISGKIKNYNPNLKVYNNSKGIQLIHGSHGCTTDVDGHSHEIDPHVWSSVPNAMIIAKNMYDAVIELDPKNTKYYTKNFDKLNAQLIQLNDSLSKELQPIRGQAFLVWHPSLSYFARDYGLKQISMESNGKESSIQNMKKRLDDAKSDSVKILFFQKEFDGRQSEIINKELGTKMVIINPMNYNWEQEMTSIADALTQK